MCDFAGDPIQLQRICFFTFYGNEKTSDSYKMNVFSFQNSEEILVLVINLKKLRLHRKVSIHKVQCQEEGGIREIEAFINLNQPIDHFASQFG